MKLRLFTRAETIRQRLIVMQLTTAVLVLTLAAAAFVAKDFFEIRGALASQLASASQVVATNLVSALVFQDDKEADKTLGSLRSNPDIIAATVLGADGRMVASYGPADDALQIGDFKSALHSDFTARGLTVYSRIEQDGELVGGLRVQSRPDLLWEGWKQAMGIVAGVLLLGVVLSLLIANYSQYSLSKPIRELAEASTRISKGGEFATRVQSRSSVLEVSNLVLQFNSLLEAIESRDQELRQSNENLERKVIERTEQITSLQKEALLTAHQAGMAQVAVGILHNVGNILNSVNIGAESILKIAHESKSTGLAKANQLLENHRGDLAGFFANDPKAKTLVDYYANIGQSLSEDQKKLKSEAQDLLKRIDLIKTVIVSQQSFSKGNEHIDEIDLADAIESALTMQIHSLNRHEIEVRKDLGQIPRVLAQRTKLIHILVNLIKNAKEAIDSNRGPERHVTIRTRLGADNRVLLQVSDTGTGISEENLKKIFTHGFTTKADGHGFGLHYCLNAITEMGGVLSVASDGPGRGATFTISLGLREAASKVI